MGGALVAYYRSTLGYETTDNAYVRQDKVSVSAEVGGRVVAVHVRENQRVAKGDLLFEIDPEPLALAVDEARAALAVARARLEELETAFANADIDIDGAQEDVTYFEREYQRLINLGEMNASSQSALRAAEHALSEARSRLLEAIANRDKAKAALSSGGFEAGTNPAVEAARVRLEQAELNLSRATITAPASGVASQLERLQIGQVLLQGLPAVSIVVTDTSWIEANFKETRIAAIRAGQPVDIEIDSFPDQHFLGHVDSIGAGTGSEFSILPAQNATGNWVKVTQRVPVRIVFDQQPALPLLAGLSAEVRIQTGTP